jgi:hypothetical protein
MKVTFWMKKQKGEFDVQQTYLFKEEEFTKLKSDFDKYSKGFDPIKGSSYKCKHEHIRSVEIILFLKFDEIVFITAYVEQ